MLAKTFLLYAWACKERFIERCQYLQIEILWILHHWKEDQGKTWHHNLLHRGDSGLCSDKCLGTYHDDIYWSNHYFLSFIDDYSRRCGAYTMKHKGEVLELFVEWKKNMEIIWKGRSRHSVQTVDESIRAILSYSYVAWGHRKALHSKRNTVIKWGGWKDEQDLTREGPLHVIQCWHIKIFLGWGIGVCLPSH